MRGFHFTLRWLFGVVSFLAIGCGLLIYASPVLSKLTFTASVTALLIALFAAIYRNGERRAFWAGFAAFGFAYLWLLCGTWQSPDGSTAVRERLLTSDLLARCYEALLASRASPLPTVYPVQSLVVPAGVYSDQEGNPLAAATGATTVGYPTMGSGLFVATPSVDRADFLTTGHSLFAILFALLGAVISRRLSSGAILNDR